MSGTKLNIVGESNNVSINIQNKLFVENFVVISNVSDNTLLLGLEFLSRSKLIIDFAEEKLTTSTSGHDNETFATIHVNGEYTIKPFSTDFICTKIEGDHIDLGKI